MTTRRDFRAMTTDIELVCLSGPRAERLLCRAERWTRAYEERMSRFLPLSEMTRLNNSAGRPFHASRLLFDQVAAALGFARRSRGIFDPTLLRQLEAAGYDRSIELIGPGPQRPGPAAAGQEAYRRVVLNRKERTITLPPGIGLDLGGIGKGWAVDRLAGILGTPGLVNAGGDIYASGRPPGEKSWLVGVEDPLGPERDLAVLAVRDRGVATSSVVKRRWRIGDHWAHHLIDPRTGRPSETDVLAVTVVAPTAVLADYHAKVALLKGAREGLRYLEREAEVEGLLVRRDDSVITSPGLAPYLVALT